MRYLELVHSASALPALNCFQAYDKLDQQDSNDQISLIRCRNIILFLQHNSPSAEDTLVQARIVSIQGTEATCEPLLRPQRHCDPRPHKGGHTRVAKLAGVDREKRVPGDAGVIRQSGTAQCSQTQAQGYRTHQPSATAKSRSRSAFVSLVSWMQTISARNAALSTCLIANSKSG